MLDKIPDAGFLMQDGCLMLDYRLLDKRLLRTGYDSAGCRIPDKCARFEPIGNKTIQQYNNKYFQNNRQFRIIRYSLALA